MYNISFTANKMPINQADYFDKELRKHNNVDIICHEDTDKDAINSALVMYEYLNQMSINSKILLSQDLRLLDLKDNKNKYIQFKDFKTPKSENAILCVDFSSPTRVPKEIQDYIDTNKEVYCIDHHRVLDNVNENRVYLTEASKNAPVIDKAQPYYIDLTAKSATSIIYRFFEALKIPISKSQAYEMFSGLVSDSAKKGTIICDGKKGTIIPTEIILEDENTYEIYKNLLNKLSSEDIAKIAKEVDIVSNLSKKEKTFQQSLYDKLKLSNNGKIAYVELSPNDKLLETIGGDNTRSSTIMNDFRQNVLKNTFNDDKLKNVECVFVFYKAKNNYRLSVHSRDINILNYYRYLAENNLISTKCETTMGGHANRAGGKIVSLDEKECHQWVKDIISGQEFFDHVQK